LLLLSMQELLTLDFTAHLGMQECLLDSEAAAKDMLTTLSASWRHTVSECRFN
jgi:hypothetical protein